MNNRFNCYTCGKFISHSSISSGVLQNIEIWKGTGFIPDLWSVEYNCNNCSKPATKTQSESNEVTQHGETKNNNTED